MGVVSDHWDFLLLGLTGSALLNKTLATLILAKVVQYHVMKPEPVPSAGAVARGSKAANPPPKTSKAAKRQLREKARQDILLGGAENISMVQISAPSVQTIEYFSYFNALVVGTLVLFGVFAIEESRVRLRGLPRGPLPFICSIVAVLIALRSLLQVDWLSPLSTKGSRTFSGVVGAMAGVVAGALLYYAPSSVLDFRLQEAAAEFDASMLRLSRMFGLASGGAADSKSMTLMLIILLAHAAGALTLLLVTAGVRWTRCYGMVTSPPSWAASQIRTSFLSRQALMLSFLAAAVTSVTWVTPMVDFWGLTAHQLCMIRVGIPLVGAVLQLLTVRTAVQAYLDTGLVTWWTKKHAIMGSEKLTPADRVRVGEYIRRSVEIINLFTGKVAVQALAPPLLTLGLIGLWFTAGLLPRVAGPSPVAGPGLVILPGSAFWECVAGFLIWWTSVSWFLSTFATLSLFRFGAIIEVPRS